MPKSAHQACAEQRRQPSADGDDAASHQDRLTTSERPGSIPGQDQLPPADDGHSPEDLAETRENQESQDGDDLPEFAFDNQARRAVAHGNALDAADVVRPISEFQAISDIARCPDVTSPFPVTDTVPTPIAPSAPPATVSANSPDEAHSVISRAHSGTLVATRTGQRTPGASHSTKSTC